MLGWAAAGLVAGCGGATPLLHPAHVEPEGFVAGAVGVSGQVVVGDAATALQDAREISTKSTPLAAAEADTYRRGALVVAALAPGVAPFVGARVGIGFDAEAGLAYTGRSARLDVRRAFQSRDWALSVGLGGSALLTRPGDDWHASLRDLDLGGVNGYGIDLPVVGGWRSPGGIFDLWLGGRVGYNRQGGQISLRGTEAASPLPWALTDAWGGGVLGFSVGFRRVFAALEFDASYHRARASAGDASVELQGWTLAPAGAIRGRFLPPPLKRVKSLRIG